MEIVVIDQLIETKNIICIVDIEADKKYFLNREAGFKIVMRDGKSFVFSENIPYESTPSQIACKKEQWATLMKRVLAQWKADKEIIPVFKL